MHEFLSASSIIHDHEWTRLLGERLTCNRKRKRLLSWENLQLLPSRKALLLTCELLGAQPHVPMYKGAKEGMSFLNNGPDSVLWEEWSSVWTKAGLLSSPGHLIETIKSSNYFYLNGFGRCATSLGKKKKKKRASGCDDQGCTTCSWQRVDLIFAATRPPVLIFFQAFITRVSWDFLFVFYSLLFEMVSFI